MIYMEKHKFFESNLIINFNLQTVFSVETANGVIEPSRWTHICATYSGSTRNAKIYVNVELKSTQGNLGGGVLSQVRE